MDQRLQRLESTVYELKGKLDILLWAVPLAIVAATGFTAAYTNSQMSGVSDQITTLRQDAATQRTEIRQEIRDFRSEVLQELRRSPPQQAAPPGR